MKKFIVGLCLLFASMHAFNAQAEVRNIVVMVIDGCGYNALQALEAYNGAAPGYLAQDWTQFGQSNYMWHADLNGTWYYNDNHFWNDFSWQFLRAGGSAAAATAISTGQKTYNGAIGVDPNGQSLSHIIETAEDLGKATGVVTSVRFSNATPAGFVAHNSSRHNYEQIVHEMLQGSECEVIMGCGHPYYDHDGNYVDNPPDSSFIYVGGVELWNLIINDQAGGAYPWTFVDRKQEFQSMANGNTPDRVLGIPRIHRSLQYYRAGNPGPHSLEPPYTVPFITSVPNLAQMTAAALNVVDNDPDGFFLMIEGGAVDRAAHGRVLGRQIEELNDFSQAFLEVTLWVESNSNWDETLVIVTSDHECGCMWGPGSGPPATFNPIIDNGPGIMPGYQYYSVDHTNQLVFFCAKGIGTELFSAHANLQDYVRGAYLDNAEIGISLAALWSGQPVVVANTFVEPLNFTVPGGFNYEVTFGNPTDMPVTADAWVSVVLPGGNVMEFANMLNDMTLQPNEYTTLTRYQPVPGNAPAGVYNFQVRMGERNVYILAEDSFQFRVTADPAAD